MEILERDRVRRLHRLFKLYERAEERFARGEIAPAEMARLTVVLRQLSFDFWRGFFGPSVDAPAHQRHVLSWSARNLEVFRRLGVLGEEEAAAVREWIGRALARLEGDDPRYDFATDGPTGTSADALRRLYLIQNLNIRLETCMRAGSLGAQVQDHVRRDLMRRARALFSSVLEGEIEDLLRERAAVHAMLEEYVRRGLLTPAALSALDPEMQPTPRPAPAGEPIPVAVLVELLRRTGTEGPAAATLVDALAQHVQATLPPPTPEALTAAVARLGLSPDLAPAPTPAQQAPAAVPSNPDVAVYTEIELGEVTSTAVDATWAEEVGQEMLAAGIKAPPSYIEIDAPGDVAPDAVASTSGAQPPAGPAAGATAAGAAGPGSRPGAAGPGSRPGADARRPPQSRPNPALGPRPVPSSPRATPGHPQMWGSPSAAPAAEPSFWESVLSAMIEELGVNWLLFSGVILVVAAGVLLAVKHWTEIRPFEQYLVILGGTLTFFALAMVTRLAMKLERTPTALFAVVLLFVPLNMIAIDMLNLLKPGDNGPAVLAQATAVAGLVVVAVMVLWGGRAISGLKPTVFAPALLTASAAYLAVSLASDAMVSPWARLAAIVATVLAARSCLPTSVRDLQRAGMLPVVLAALSLATAATGLRTGHDLLTIGLTVTGVAHLWLEAAFRLATLTQGPLEEPPGALPRILATIGQITVMAGACLALLPQPHHNPLGLIALAYASRMLYTAFFTHRTGFTFLTFLVTPGPLLFLLPDATAQLSLLWRTPLLEVVTRAGFDPLFVDLLPLVLVGPFHAHLAARLARRGLEAPRALLHVVGAAVAVITLIVTFLPAWLGAVAAAITVVLWGVLATRHTDPAERHLAGVAALGGAALVIEGIRLLQLPEWVWLLSAVLLAYALLALHLRAAARDARAPNAPPSLIPHGLGDFLFPASLTTAGLSLAAYLRALSLGEVLGSGGAGYDLSLVLLAIYFTASLYAQYNAARALITVPLLALEAWVLLIRFDQVHVTNAGYWVGLTALFPWAVGLALDSEAGRALLERSGPRALKHDSVRDSLVTFYCGLAQAAATLAFWIPPVEGWLGSGKYILLAAVHGLLIRRLPSNALQSFLCFMVGFHIPLRTMLHQPWPCLTLQLMDLIMGLLLLANARRLHARLPAAAGDAPLIQIAGSLLLAVSTGIYLIGPFLSYNSDPVASFLASAAQVALGGGLIGLAWVLDSELAVYAGEVAIMLVYARLFIQGYIPRTLVMGFISLALSFVFLFMRERLFSQPRYRVYRNPAANTALVLPLFTVLRGVDYGGPTGAVLVFMAGVFYHMASWRGGQPQCLYFGLLLYNVASAMFPVGPGFLGACRYLVPVGITLLVYTHTPGTGLSRDQISGWRMLGTALIVGEPLPRALLGTRDDIAFLLLIGLSIVIAMAGLVLRVRLYLGAGTGLFILAVLSFVAKQIFQTTHLGLFSLLILGVVLIFAGAVFEQARARLRHLAAHLKTRFQDWE